MFAKVYRVTKFDFSYTGGIQRLIIPVTGLYKLEIWGCIGASNDSEISPPGKGGYSVGYKVLTAGDVLYIGGGGNEIMYSSYGMVTFNGGGYGREHAGHGGGGDSTGGGWYGGGAGYCGYNQDELAGVSGGGGGSGYIGGVPTITFNGQTYSPSTTAGANSDLGRATITLLDWNK